MNDPVEGYYVGLWNRYIAMEWGWGEHEPRIQTFDEFCYWSRRWDREYQAAWDCGDMDTVYELESMLA